MLTKLLVCPAANRAVGEQGQPAALGDGFHLLAECSRHFAPKDLKTTVTGRV